MSHDKKGVENESSDVQGIYSIFIHIWVLVKIGVHYWIV